MPSTTVPAAAPGLLTSRRALLAGLAVIPLAPCPATASAAHPDAELLAHEPHLVAMACVVEELRAIFNQVEAVAYGAAEPRPDICHGRDWDAFRDRLSVAKVEAAYEEADQAVLAADRRLMDAAKVLTSIPARTLDGLRMKARFAECGDVDEIGLAIIDDLLAMDGKNGDVP